MAFVDYYKILGLDKNASDKDIKAAYRKLARKYHPDVNPNDESAKKRFQELNEANEVLGDPEKRKKFDKYGANWENGDAYEQARRGGGGFGENGFSDFFESMFGGRSSGSRQAKYRGQDFNAELNLTIHEAYETRKQTLTVNGKNIRMTIPAGIENGQTIKVPGHGGNGANGGPNGDLYITFNISNDSNFKRSGNDLFLKQEIDLYSAILGGEIVVETMSGKVKLPIKPETQNESVVRLKGKGFPVYKKEGQFGDLYITFHVKIPTNLTEEQKKLFIEISKLTEP